MIYVTPTPNALRGQLLSTHRLYAYPLAPKTVPDGGFAILDSGAFALAQRGQAITPAYMLQLAAHYAEYQSANVHCIAPDEYLSPAATLANWRHWHQHFAIAIVPVIQFKRAKTLDLYTAIRQAKAYAPCAPSFVAISNPALSAALSGTLMQQICTTVRAITGATWLHNLGAGWHPKDIAAWRELACFDSIDSIAYYTDAQDGYKWRADGYRERSKDKWIDLAVHNARIAQEIARGTHL